MSTSIILAILLICVFFGIRSYRKKLVSGCCGGGDTAPRKVRVQDQTPAHYPYTKVLSVDGMTCPNCAAHVQNALNSLDGVFSKVDLGKKSAMVHMKADVPDQLLRKAVAEAGYTVTSVSQTSRMGA